MDLEVLYMGDPVMRRHSVCTGSPKKHETLKMRLLSKNFKKVKNA